MNDDEFEEVLTYQLDRVRDILGSKAEEYATTDRLHNFRVASTLHRGDLKIALGGMMAKHTVSIYDMINSGQQHPIEQWDEKITDHINYLILLRAIVEDEVKNAMGEFTTVMSRIKTEDVADVDIPAIKKHAMDAFEKYQKGES